MELYSTQYTVSGWNYTVHSTQFQVGTIQTWMIIITMIIIIFLERTGNCTVEPIQTWMIIIIMIIIILLESSGNCTVEPI